MEEGVHSINGEIWEAGYISEVDDYWKTVNFKSGSFTGTPVILAQTVTNNNVEAVVTRIKDVTANSFKIRLQEQEGGDGIIWPREDVHYIATQAKSGDFDGRKFLAFRKDNCLTDEWYNENWTGSIGTIESPVFIAGMQSCNDSDPCALRYKDISESGVDIKVEEEQSLDIEVEHSPEDLGYLVVASGVPNAPSNLIAIAVSDIQIDLTWVDNSDIEDGFKIERKEGSGSFSQIMTVDSNVTSWSDRELNLEITYTYRVRAYNSAGNSAYSNEACELPMDLVLQNITVEIDTTKFYQAYNSITAAGDSTYFLIKGNGSTGGNVTMQTGNYISLLAGFYAQTGCSFSAYIENPVLSDEEITGPLALNYEPDSNSVETKIEDKKEKEPIPKVFSCSQNSPNPFNINTTIRYGLPKSSKVSLCIYNLVGQKVQTLVDANESAGYKSVSWDGRTSSGKDAPQGIYFYKFQAGNDFEKTYKMIVVK
jgi:hypothetical protein